MSANKKAKSVAIWSTKDVVASCPLCKAPAIVELTPAIKAAQPDDTSHVCHPGFGGCNHGFAMQAAQ